LQISGPHGSATTRARRLTPCRLQAVEVIDAARRDNVAWLIFGTCGSGAPDNVARLDPRIIRVDFADRRTAGFGAPDQRSRCVW
jgi:hypothetical protein